MVKKSALVAALTVALVVCGAAVAAHHRAQRKHGTVVELRKTKLGRILVTRSGRTLYLYTPDGRNKSNCTGSCASIWPPLMTKGRPKAGMGVRQTLLRTTRRANGKRQVTYKGHPLYLYVGDHKAGQVKGEGYGGIWYAVNAAGKKVTAKQSSGGGTTTGGGGGYGY